MMTALFLLAQDSTPFPSGPIPFARSLGADGRPRRRGFYNRHIRVRLDGFSIAIHACCATIDSFHHHVARFAPPLDIRLLARQVVDDHPQHGEPDDDWPEHLEA